MIKVKVMSRGEAIRYCHKPHPESSAIISISSPSVTYSSSKPFVGEDNGVRAVLPLCFEDVDCDVPSAMTIEDARRIRNFIERFADVDQLIVHCDAGVSRSAGVAAAILKAKTGDDSAIFRSFWYSPNKWCYRKTLDALTEEK